MRAARGLLLGFVLLLAASLVGSAWAQPAAGQCKELACPKCAGLCTAYCEVEAEACRKAGKRGCPGAYRSCTKGCTNELCAQCLPVQYGKDDRRFLPGKTQLCRIEGHWAEKK